MIKHVSVGEKIEHSKIYHYDVVILGAGPAGLTAAIYASRYGMKTAIISKEVGGMANWAEDIDNFPGYSGSGRDLMQNFFNHAVKFGAEMLEDDIISLERDDNGLIIAVSSKKIIHARSIIIALGTQRKKLNIKGEDKFLGKGVSYCATCDGYFFKKKNVAVVGGADAACKSALLLSEVANSVYLIHRGEKEKCANLVLEKLRKKKNVISLANSSPMEIKGKGKVEELVIWKDDKEQSLKIDGVFIEIGGMPLSDMAKMLKIDTDSNGYINVNSDMKTNIPGIFAAGDVIKGNLKQVVVAASQGAIAAKSAFDFVSAK